MDTNETIIGISLGTTNVSMAIMTENGASVIPYQDGSYLMPAVVAYKKNGVLVGGAHRIKQV